MLLRGFLFTLLCYQVVNAGSKHHRSTTKVEHGEIDVNSPPLKYFWGTVREVMNAFIRTWNGKNAKDTRPRETLEEIWYALERTMKNPIGSVSLMRVSDHFADTMTHATAQDTLDKVFTTAHEILLRNNSNFWEKDFKPLMNGKAGTNALVLKNMLSKEWKDLHEDKKLIKSVNLVTSWMNHVFKTSEQQSKPTLERQKSRKGSEQSKRPTLDRQKSKRELKRPKSGQNDS